MPLDQTEATNQLAAELGKATYPATVTPVRGRLMTAMGGPTSNGTEVVNSGGSTYSSADVSAALTGSVAAGTISNAQPITWSNLPTCTVVGIELWDSAGTPKRKRYGPLAQSKAVAQGDSLTMAAGALVMTQS